ncbi:hypothetical protein HA466_0176390 [Hirschfeldia incana]|nr:hypothetical protein HA466_0176390 [Hirschfeldia incana]
MALFFNRILKLRARRDNARFFSSLPESPYLLLGGKKLRDSPEGQVGKHMFFDPTKERKVYSSEKTVSQELNGQRLLGASQGWVACPENKEFTVHLTDLYKPWVSSPVENLTPTSQQPLGSIQLLLSFTLSMPGFLCFTSS